MYLQQAEIVLRKSQCEGKLRKRKANFRQRNCHNHMTTGTPTGKNVLTQTCLKTKCMQEMIHNTSMTSHKSKSRHFREAIRCDPIRA